MPSHQAKAEIITFPVRNDTPAALVARWLLDSPEASQVVLYHRSKLALLPDLTPQSIVAWLERPRPDGQPCANNTIRERLSMLRMFGKWLLKTGTWHNWPLDDIDRTIRRRYPKTYGKRQSKNPARFLTYDQAFGQLLDACKDGTWVGSRDQLLIRFGLLGLRRNEIARLRWQHLTPDGCVRITGKGNRVREVRPGPTMLNQLARWRRHYETELGRPLTGDDPILCRAVAGQHFATGAVRRTRTQVEPRILWGHALSTGDTIRQIILKRANKAGLGHVATHDLRRSAAKIMHDAKTPDGGHIFDLDDIATALDHVDPAVTRRSYLDHMDTGVKTTAGQALD